MSSDSSPGADFRQPDYGGGGLYNLIAAIGQACGGARVAPALGGVDSAGWGGARSIVLLLVDGLGERQLRGAGAASSLAAMRECTLTSVFPSTTASAITTVMTGLAPAAHGLTGWHMYFSELDAVGAVLPLTARDPAAERWAPDVAARLFSRDTFYRRIARPAWVLSPADIADSAFNRYHSAGARRLAYGSLPAMFQALEELVRADGPPRFIYAYYPELDSAAHRHGIGSLQVAAVLAQFERALAAWRRQVRGSSTLLLVSADHGFIDSPPDRLIELESHPALAACLARPLCGERRVAWCYLRPGKADAFCDYADAQLGHAARCVPSERLITEGWFGPGPAHARLASRVGDYALLMRENWTIKDTLPGEKRHRMIGVHGGASADEMLVPLCVDRL